MLKILRNERDIFREVVENYFLFFQKIERYRLKRDLVKKLLDQFKSKSKLEFKSSLFSNLTLKVTSTSAILLIEITSHKIEKSFKLSNSKLFIKFK